MNEYARKAIKEQKTVLEFSQNVINGEELAELTEAVKQQGGIIVAAFPIRGKKGLTVTYRIPKD
jgi:hypothetical protein